MLLQFFDDLAYYFLSKRHTSAPFYPFFFSFFFTLKYFLISQADFTQTLFLWLFKKKLLSLKVPTQLDIRKTGYLEDCNFQMVLGLRM